MSSFIAPESLGAAEEPMLTPEQYARYQAAEARGWNSEQSMAYALDPGNSEVVNAPNQADRDTGVHVKPADLPTYTGMPFDARAFFGGLVPSPQEAPTVILVKQSAMSNTTKVAAGIAVAAGLYWWWKRPVKQNKKRKRISR